MNWDWWKRMIDTRMLKAELEFHQHLQASMTALKTMQMQGLRKDLTEERVAQIREAIGQLQAAADSVSSEPVR